MLNFRNLSLQRKQTLIMMLTSSVVLLLVCAAFVTYNVVTFRRELAERVSVLAEAIGNNCAAAIDFNDPKAAAETLNALHAEGNIISACVYSRDGQVFAVYQRDGASSFVPPAARPAGQEFTSDQLHLFRPIKQQGVMTGMIFVASDLKELSESLIHYISIAGIVFLASLLVALGLSSQLQRLVSDPVLRLARVARSVAVEKNYSVRATKQSNDELGQLVDGFNEMLAQIQERDANLERRVEERTNELARSLSLLNATLESTADGILVVNFEGQISSYNQKFIKLWNISESVIATPDDRQLLAAALTQLKHPEDFLAKVKDLYAHPDVQSSDIVELADGRIFERFSQPQKLGDKCIGRVWSFRDITEHKRAELALQMFQYSIDQASHAVFWMKRDAGFSYVNDQACRALGYTREELLRLHLWDINPGFSKELWFSRWEGYQNNRQGGSEHMESVHRRKDGSTLPIEVVTKHLWLGEKELHVAFVQDITERRQAEEALRESQALYHSLVEQLPMGVFRKDSQGRYVFVNPWFCRLEGRTAEEFIGKTPRELAASQLAKQGAMTLMTRYAIEGESHHELIMRTGETIGLDEEHRGADGRTQFVHVIKSPVFGPDGKIVGSQGIVVDISQRKYAAQELERVHGQLIEASRLSGMAEIATNVLHNIGNVLNSVNVSASLVVNSVKKSKASSLAKVVALLREHEHDLGTFFTTDPRGGQLPAYLSKLSEHFLDDQKATVKELDSLRSNIEHIKEIVAMQQRYAKVSGIKEIININELVEDSLRITEGTLNHHRVEIIREFENVKPINVEKHKILQILVNLVRNAKHACQDSERPDRLLTLCVVKDDNHIRISVADNGVGIPAENLTRIFSHGFTTRKDGHGFGLHSGALAAREMGGSLTVHSGGPGLGATFTLELPVPPDVRPADGDQHTPDAMLIP